MKRFNHARETIFCEPLQDETMFQPQVQFTHTVALNLQRIEEMRRLLNVIPVMPNWEFAIRREALVKTVHSSAAIEGNRLSPEDAARIVGRVLDGTGDGDGYGDRRGDGYGDGSDYGYGDGHGDGGGSGDRESIEIRNLARLMHELFHYGLQAIPADERMIREMNRRILKDVPDSELATPGEYRRGQNHVEDSTGRIVFTPPEAGDVPDLMRQLSDWLQLDHTGLHPILKAGVAHLELVAIHPFWDGNGRVGRALATYVMYSTGYDFRRFHSWETYLNQNVGAYTSAIAGSVGDHYYQRTRDYTPWLEYFTEALATTLDGLREEIEDLRRAWDAAYKAGAGLGVDQTQVQALAYASYYGSVTTDLYGHVVGVSRATAYRHLNALERKDLLVRSGRGRASRYIPGPALRAVPLPFADFPDVADEVASQVQPL